MLVVREKGRIYVTNFRPNLTQTCCTNTENGCVRFDLKKKKKKKKKKKNRSILNMKHTRLSFSIAGDIFYANMIESLTFVPIMKI